MKLVLNAKRIVARSYSMWAIYLGILCLVVPEFLFYVFEWDTNPRIWWIAGLVLLIGGAAGRLIEQGIDRSKTRSPIWIVLLAAIAVAGQFYSQNLGADVAITAVDGPAVDSGSMTVSDAVFLSQAIPIVAPFEVLRLRAYPDTVGVWMVCFGETLGVKAGDEYSQAEC